MHDVFIVSRSRRKTLGLMCQMEAHILALVVIDVDGNFLDQVERFSVGWLEVLEIGPENVVILARRQALFKLATVVGIDFPARLIGLVFAATDFYVNSIHWTVIGSPHGPDDHGVRLSSGFLSCEEAIPRTEGRQENESGNNSEEWQLAKKLNIALRSNHRLRSPPLLRLRPLRNLLRRLSTRGDWS